MVASPSTAPRCTTSNSACPSTSELAARVTLDGQKLDPLPGFALMLYKPVGVTCSHKEAGPLVYSLLPARWRRRDPADIQRRTARQGTRPACCS